MKTVLILGIQSSVGLTSLKSLAKQGFKCVGVSLKEGGVGLYSKHVAHGYTLIYRRDEEQRFIDELLDIVEKHNVEGILTHHELYMMILNRHRDLIERKTKCFFPDSHILAELLDKDAFLKKAEKLNIKVPKTVLISSKDDIVNISDTFNFPGILKISSNLKKGLLNKKWQFKTKYFEDRESFIDFCSDFPEEQQQTFVLQEFIQGDYIGLGIAYQKGKVVAAFQWTALREYEPGLGGYRKSIDVNPVLLNYAEKLCDFFKYEGVCEVEFRGKLDDIENISLMEINPRLWGGVSLGVYCGIDFPYLAYKIYNQENLSTDEPQAKTGIYSRNFLGDTKWLLKVFSGKGIGEGNPNFQYKKRQAFLDYFSAFFKTHVYDLEDLSDPKPFLMHYYKKMLRKA